MDKIIVVPWADKKFAECKMDPAPLRCMKIEEVISKKDEIESELKEMNEILKLVNIDLTYSSIHNYELLLERSATFLVLLW